MDEVLDRRLQSGRTCTLQMRRRQVDQEQPFCYLNGSTTFSGSSVKTVGEFWLGKFAKYMI